MEEGLAPALREIPQEVPERVGFSDSKVGLGWLGAPLSFVPVLPELARHSRLPCNLPVQ